MPNSVLSVLALGPNFVPRVAEDALATAKLTDKTAASVKRALLLRAF